MITYVYSGIGTQWCGMGAYLYYNNSVFKETIDRINEQFLNIFNYSIKNILLDKSNNQILKPEIAHPAIFTFQIALSEVLINNNIIPDTIIGHSAGELAGSVTAGILSVDDALKVLYAHSQLIAKSNNKGIMLFAACNVDTINKISENIEFAAINSINSLVLTGNLRELKKIEKKLDEKNIFHKKLNINVPFHSDIIEEHLSEFNDFIKDIRPQPPKIKFYSSLQGDILTLPMDNNYWTKHIRKTVNFSDTINKLLDIGVSTFIEISPHNHLVLSIKENIFHKKSSAKVIPTVQKNSNSLDFIENIKKQIKGLKKTKNNKFTDPDSLKTALKNEIEIILKNQNIDNIFDSSFFDIGLNSLNIIQLSEKFHISPVVFFKNPTINSLTANIFSNKTVKIKTRSYKKITESHDIAVIGIGCRFPDKVNSPEEFFEFLQEGKSIISTPPANRKNWLNDNYKAGYLKSENIWEFDNTFFNMPAMEAAFLDPQHRLLLETTVEALENAMCTTDEIQEKRTGVFLGISTDDYKYMTFYTDKPNSYAGTGNLFSTASGRLSYYFNLKGPSISVDTACSSSLAAAHYAINSLKTGETDIAIVAGVNIIILPILFDYFKHVGALSPSFQCKTFDKYADGYARGEGCGVIVLKRLKDAIKDNNIIDAIIKGSAINQDGKSTVLTAPNGESQAQLVREALSNANLDINDIDFIETHGTGTQLGDSIEVNSLGEVFKDNPKKIYLGALKSLTGHLEAASGIAGLIKAILLVKNRAITPNDNFSEPNQYIDFNNLPFLLPRKVEKFKQNNPVKAGVSSFGYSGTNVHVIVEEFKQKTEMVELTNLPYNILVFSAKTETSLKKLLNRYSTYLNNFNGSLFTSLSYSQMVTRNHYKNRLAIVFKDKDELFQKLNYFSNQNLKSKNGSNKICFLFPGQGVQYNNMCKELYDTFESYRKPFDKCTRLVEKIAGFNLKDLIFNDKENPLIHETFYTHPVVFSCSYSLSKMWEDWGIVPDTLLGQSFGEYSVLSVGEVLSLEDAVKFVVKRGELMSNLPPNGRMMAVLGNIDKAKPILNKYNKIKIALISSSNNFVVTGNSEEIKNAANELNGSGLVATVLNISIASHCELMSPISKPLESFGKKLTFNKSKIPIYNNIDAEIKYYMPPEYFSKQLLSCVQFQTCITNAINDGVNVFMEMGPTSALSNVIKENSKGKNIYVLQSASKRKNSIQVIMESIKTLYEIGYNLNWANIYKNFNLKKLRMPNYCFDKKIFIPKNLNFETSDKQFIQNKNIKKDKKISNDKKKISVDNEKLIIELFEKFTNRHFSKSIASTNFTILGIDKLTLSAIIKEFEKITDKQIKNINVKTISTPDNLIEMAKTC